MNAKIKQALDNVSIAYSELVAIANDITNPYLTEVNELISHAESNINNLTNDDLRLLLMKLSTKAFLFSEIKEKTALKSQVAETLRKEAYATNFNGIEGTVAVRENTATINTSQEILAELVCDLVANLFKIKLDELHRIVDTLKTVLTTRLQEAKLTTFTIGE